MASVYLCLGSNLGNREIQLLRAESEIEKYIGQVIKKSSVYETEPWGLSADINFLNQVLLVETNHKPDILIKKCLEIETKMGRIRNSQVYESRIIDIDVIFYGNEIINNDKLTVPHPHIASRRFVLEPLCEISPAFIHPLLKKTVMELLHICPDKMLVKKL